MSEADKVREALRDDPFVSNADYGRLVEEAADADERASWQAERDEDLKLAEDLAEHHSKTLDEARKAIRRAAGLDDDDVT